jgi:hypothetical protein
MKNKIENEFILKVEAYGYILPLIAQTMVKMDRHMDRFSIVGSLNPIIHLAIN